MKNKKGFTLIELLAVIVILAIIALIAVPIILNMINNAKRSTAISSTYGYIEAVDNYQTMSQLKGLKSLKEGKYNVAIKTNNMDKLNNLLNVKGSKPSAGYVEISKSSRVSGAILCFQDYIVRYINTKAEIISEDCSNLGLIVELSVEKEGWQPSRKININYPQGNYKYYYRVTGNAKVEEQLVEKNKEIETTNEFTITLEENQTLELWMIKNGKKVGITKYVEDKIDNVVPILPEGKATSGYAVITKYGIESSINLEISNFNSQNGTSAYYSIDDGKTWIKYTEETSVKTSFDTIKAKMVRDESKIESEIKDITIEAGSANDGITSAAYDGDLSTNVSVNSGSKKLLVDQSVWGRKLLLTGYVRKYMTHYSSISFKVDGTVKLYKKYSGDESLTLNKEEIIVPENATEMLFESEKSTSYYIRIDELEVSNQPVLNIEKVYPTLTVLGFEEPYVNVTSTYYDTSVQKKYKLNDGEWENYTQTLKLKLGDKVEFKGIDKNGKDSLITTYEAVISDKLDKEAYDNDLTTSVTVNSGTKKIAIDKSIWGRKLLLTGYVRKYMTHYSSISFKVDGTVKLYKKYSGDESLTLNKEEIIVPENATEMLFESEKSTSYYIRIDELEVSNQPVLNIEKVYPTLTVLGFEEPYVNVTSTYYDTSVQKKYKLNDGEWENYTQTLKLKLGDKVEFKGIDKNGKDSLITTYEAVISDKIDKEAYDNDLTTSVTVNSGTKKLGIDKSMWGKKILLTGYVNKYMTNYSSISFKVDGEVKLYKKYSGDGRITLTKEPITIPENATEIIFESGSNTSYYIRIDEIEIDNS